MLTTKAVIYDGTPRVGYAVVCFAQISTVGEEEGEKDGGEGRGGGGVIDQEGPQALASCRQACEDLERSLPSGTLQNPARRYSLSLNARRRLMSACFLGSTSQSVFARASW